jgi:hypothetical protein
VQTYPLDAFAVADQIGRRCFCGRLGIEEGKIIDTRLYSCLDRILPHKTPVRRVLYDLTRTYVEGAARKKMMRLGYSRDHRVDDGDDPADGGAQVRQGAADLSVRSRDEFRLPVPRSAIRTTW